MCPKVQPLPSSWRTWITWPTVSVSGDDSLKGQSKVVGSKLWSATTRAESPAEEATDISVTAGGTTCDSGGALTRARTAASLESRSWKPSSKEASLASRAAFCRSASAAVSRARSRLRAISANSSRSWSLRHSTGAASLPSLAGAEASSSPHGSPSASASSAPSSSLPSPSPSSARSMAANRASMAALARSASANESTAWSRLRASMAQSRWAFAMRIRSSRTSPSTSAARSLRSASHLAACTNKGGSAEYNLASGSGSSAGPERSQALPGREPASSAERSARESRFRRWSLSGVARSPSAMLAVRMLSNSPSRDALETIASWSWSSRSRCLAASLALARPSSERPSRSLRSVACSCAASPSCAARASSRCRRTCSTAESLASTASLASCELCTSRALASAASRLSRKRSRSASTSRRSSASSR
mmetsp:Transcript_19016/g.52375  ORF Transcript_19016/g.52375 Transcript_19016/m.52375 type:complete len:424 (+) Transcript_19016:2560-3831(+)